MGPIMELQVFIIHLHITIIVHMAHRFTSHMAMRNTIHKTQIMLIYMDIHMILIEVMTGMGSTASTMAMVLMR